MLVLSRETSLKGLIGQFEDFEMSEEPMVRLLRFHLHLSQLEDHGPWLINSLENSMNSSVEEKLIAAQYLSFLETFYSNEQLEDLNLLRQKMLQRLHQNMLESQGARKFIGMLSREQELVSYMAQARTLIQELTRISDLSPISAFVDIMVKHMEWKAKRKVLVRAKSINQNKFIHNVIDFLTSEHGQREEILSGMARLAAATMNYLKQINYFTQEDANPINRNKLIRMRQAWLALTIYKHEAALEICKTIAISFHLLGLQSERAGNEIHGKIYNFLHNHENCMNQSEYLELLLTFLNNLEEVKEQNRSEITRILSKLFKTIISGSQTSTRVSYRSKAMMSDIIIKISSLFTCEPSKQITKLIRPEHSQNQLAFIGALLVIFDQKMSNEYLNSIPQNRRHYVFITKEHVLYKETLRRYCDPNFDFSQSILNPEIREQLMWDLLLLRIAIEINYNSLCQLDNIHVLVNNLIKMAILDCLPDQCYQILEKLIQLENIYTIRELNKLPLIKIIQDVKPILVNQVRDMENPIQKFTTMYRNLYKVITLLSKNHNLEQLQQPTLFIRVLRINDILNDYSLTAQLMKNQKQLLSACILLCFKDINKNELIIAVNELIDHIEKHKSLQTFLIFLEVMNRSRPYSSLHPIYTELNAAIENVIKQVRIPPTVMQSYRILNFLLSKPEITCEVVKDAWDLIRNVDSYHYLDQFHSVIQLHKYSDNYIRDNHSQADQINYLVYQMEQIIGMLNYLEDKLDNTAFLTRIEELTRYKLAILDYCLLVVTRYTKANGFACNQTAKINRYLHIAFNSMRETPQLATIFNIRPGIRLKWSNCQFCILLLIAHLRTPKLCFSERSIPELIKDLDQKRELLRKMYPQEYKATLQYYSRLLNCKTIELGMTLRAEMIPRR